MRRFMLCTALAVVFAAPAAVAANRFTVVERAASDTVTDVGATGDSVGDILTFANDLYDDTNRTKVGTDQGFCVRTVAGSAYECVMTLMLEGGQITLEGPFYDKGDSMAAITGGTGRYATARGDAKLHYRDEKGTEFDFVIHVR